MLRSGPPRRAAAALADGDQLLARGEPAAAARAFGEALARLADGRSGAAAERTALLAAAHLGLGRARLAATDPAAARDHFRTAREALPDDWRGWHWSGCAAAHLGDDDAAESHFTAALARQSQHRDQHPDQHRSLRQRARVRARQGRTRAALDDLATAARQQPPEASDRWLVAVLRLRAGDWKQAEEALRTLLDPGSPRAATARGLLGYAREQQGDTAAALAPLLRRKDYTGALRQLASSEPHWPPGALDDTIVELSLYAAWRAFTSGTGTGTGAAAPDAAHRERARTHLAEAQRRRPDDPRVLHCLALLAYGGGARREAVALWTRALRHRPGDRRIRYALALCRAQAGEEAAAETELAALAGDPAGDAVASRAALALAALRVRSGRRWAAAADALALARQPGAPPDPLRDALLAECRYRSGQPTSGLWQTAAHCRAGHPHDALNSLPTAPTSNAPPPDRAAHETGLHLRHTALTDPAPAPERAPGVPGAQHPGRTANHAPGAAPAEGPPPGLDPSLSGAASPKSAGHDRGSAPAASPGTMSAVARAETPGQVAAQAAAHTQAQAPGLSGAASPKSPTRPPGSTTDASPVATAAGARAASSGAGEAPDQSPGLVPAQAPGPTSDMAPAGTPTASSAQAAGSATAAPPGATAAVAPAEPPGQVAAQAPADAAPPAQAPGLPGAAPPKSPAQTAASARAASPGAGEVPDAAAGTRPASAPGEPWAVVVAELLDHGIRLAPEVPCGGAVFEAAVLVRGGRRDAALRVLSAATRRDPVDHRSAHALAVLLLNTLAEGTGRRTPSTEARWEQCLAMWGVVLHHDGFWREFRQRSARRCGRPVTDELVESLRTGFREHLEALAPTGAPGVHPRLLWQREAEGARLLGAAGGLPLRSTTGPSAGAAARTDGGGRLVCGPLRIAELALQAEFGAFAAARGDPVELRLWFSQLGVAQAQLSGGAVRDALRSLADLRCPRCRTVRPADRTAPAGDRPVRPYSCAPGCAGFDAVNPAYAGRPEKERRLSDDAVAMARDALFTLGCSCLTSADPDLPETAASWRGALARAAELGTTGETRRAIVDTALGRAETLHRADDLSGATEVLDLVYGLIDETGRERVRGRLAALLTDRGIHAANDDPQSLERPAADLRRAVELNPHHLRAQTNLGVVLRLLAALRIRAGRVGDGIALLHETSDRLETALEHHAGNEELEEMRRDVLADLHRLL